MTPMTPPLPRRPAEATPPGRLRRRLTARSSDGVIAAYLRDISGGRPAPARRPPCVAPA